MAHGACDSPWEGRKCCVGPRNSNTDRTVSAYGRSTFNFFPKEEPKARGERLSRNTSQPHSDYHGQNALRQVGAKVRGNREKQDIQRREHHGEEAPCQNDSKPRVDCNGRDVSHKSEPRPRDATDHYKIEFRESRHRRQMIVSDRSDSDSPKSEPPPKRTS
jgi:hypothetical protein